MKRRLKAGKILILMLLLTAIWGCGLEKHETDMRKDSIINNNIDAYPYSLNTLIFVFNGEKNTTIIASGSIRGKENKDFREFFSRDLENYVRESENLESVWYATWSLGTGPVAVRFNYSESLSQFKMNETLVETKRIFEQKWYIKRIEFGYKGDYD